ELDAAILFGPIAGYFAARAAPTKVAVVPLRSEPGIQFEFAMAAGVRFGDRERRAELESLMARTAADTAALLAEFHVPVVEAPAERVYVTNEDAGTISIISTATQSVIGEVDVGTRPRGVELSADGGRLGSRGVRRRRRRATPVRFERGRGRAVDRRSCDGRRGADGRRGRRARGRAATPRSQDGLRHERERALRDRRRYGERRGAGQHRRGLAPARLDLLGRRLARLRLVGARRQRGRRRRRSEQGAPNHRVAAGLAADGARALARRAAALRRERPGAHRLRHRRGSRHRRRRRARRRSTVGHRVDLRRQVLVHRQWTVERCLGHRHGIAERRRGGSRGQGAVGHRDRPAAARTAPARTAPARTAPARTVIEGDPSMIFRTTCATLLLLASAGAAHAQQATPTPGGDDPAALRAEIERLKSIVPGQATAMTQVAYNFNNLWFAAHAGNWPL